MYQHSSFQFRFPSENAIVRYVKRAQSAHKEYLQIEVELRFAGWFSFSSDSECGDGRRKKCWSAHCSDGIEGLYWMREES